MYQNKTTGAFHFEGSELDDCEKWFWCRLMDLSWRGIIEVCLRIVFKKPKEAH